jgi:hypothetical protein
LIKNSSTRLLAWAIYLKINKMELEELHFKLKELGIPETDYYLHGLYLEQMIVTRCALTILKGKYGLEYEVYFKEKGSVHS